MIRCIRFIRTKYTTLLDADVWRKKDRRGVEIRYKDNITGKKRTATLRGDKNLLRLENALRETRERKR